MSLIAVNETVLAVFRMAASENECCRVSPATVSGQGISVGHSDTRCPCQNATRERSKAAFDETVCGPQTGCVQ